MPKNFSPRCLIVASIALAAILASGVAAGQTIIERIDTYSEGVFSLSQGGTTSMQETISTFSSDHFDQRRVSVSGATADADFDSAITPSVNLFLDNGEFTAIYSNNDSSTTDLTSGGANGLLLQVEEQVIGESLSISAGNSNLAVNQSIVLDGSLSYFIPFSRFSGVDVTDAFSVGYAIDHSNSSSNFANVTGFYTAQSVPEPSSFAAMAGLTAATFLRRRRRN